MRKSHAAWTRATLAGMVQESIEWTELADSVRARASGRGRYLFGIAGPPGSGKTTVASQLARELGAPVVPMDGYHLPNAVLDEHGLRGVKGAPQTFDAGDFVATVARLRAAVEDVALPAFDRVTDEPNADQIRVSAAERIVIVDGNYLLIDLEPWSALADLFDAVAYIDVDREVRVDRLIARHVEFGRTHAAATAFVLESDEANTAVIEAARHRADLIVRVT